VVDHIVPLKRGGADLPNNMQWQNVAEAKAKDRVEWSRCSAAVDRISKNRTAIGQPKSSLKFGRSVSYVLHRQSFALIDLLNK